MREHKHVFCLSIAYIYPVNISLKYFVDTYKHHLDSILGFNKIIQRENNKNAYKSDVS